MQVKALAWRKGGIGTRHDCAWSKLDVGPAIVRDLLFKGLRECVESSGFVGERLAVVGEGQGNEPSACQPTVDLAEDDSVCQSHFGRSKGEHYRPVPIGSRYGL